MNNKAGSEVKKIFKRRGGATKQKSNREAQKIFKRRGGTTWQDRAPRVHTKLSKGVVQVNIKCKEDKICDIF